MDPTPTRPRTTRPAFAGASPGFAATTLAPRPGGRERLVVRHGGQPGRELDLRRDGPMRAGRDPGCEIVLRDETVSRQHAVFEYRDGGWYVTDQGSQNGTWLNRVRIPQGQAFRFRSGDVLRIGEFVVSAVFGAAPEQAPGQEGTQDLGGTQGGSNAGTGGARDEDTDFGQDAAGLSFDEQVAAVCGRGTTRIRRPGPGGEAAGIVEGPPEDPLPIAADAPTRRERFDDTTQVLLPLETTARLIVGLPRGFRAYVVSRSKVTVGRGEHCDICVPHPTVSSTHAEVVYTRKGFQIVDQGSTNGTWNGETAIQRMGLANGTALRLGHAACLFQVPLEQGRASVDSPLDPESERRFAEFLARSGRIPEHFVRDALEFPRKRGQTLGEILLFRGAVTPEVYAAAVRAYEQA